MLKKLRVQKGASLYGLEACRLIVTGCPFLFTDIPVTYRKEAGMSEKINYSSWFKPWWKALLVIGLFPFTLSYFIWKQKWQTPAKIGAIVLVWIIFIGIGSSNSSNTSTLDTQATQAETKPTPTPEPQYTLEQKKADYIAFHEKYSSYAKGMILLQTRIIALAESNITKEEFYLQLENISNLQSGFSQMGFDLEVPASLKEYKELNQVKSNLGLAGGFFQKSVDSFKKYLNKNDLEALSDAKRQSDVGTRYLNESADKMEAVAKELGVNLEELKR